MAKPKSKAPPAKKKKGAGMMNLKAMVYEAQAKKKGKKC